jgi:hypothetical protein
LIRRHELLMTTQAQHGFYGLCCVCSKTRAAASLVLSSACGHEALQVFFFELPSCSPGVNREAVAFNGRAHRHVVKDGGRLAGEKLTAGHIVILCLPCCACRNQGLGPRWSCGSLRHWRPCASVEISGC